MYTGAIIAATGVGEREAKVVEEVMRVNSPTLDALTVGEFDSLARLSLAAYRRLDPETARFYERQAGVEGGV
jgi:hypothetical protein